LSSLYVQQHWVANPFCWSGHCQSILRPGIDASIIPGALWRGTVKHVHDGRTIIMADVKAPKNVPGPDVSPVLADSSARATPYSLTPLFGRHDDVARIRAQLDSGQVRLLTLTGPGGVGKTCLAEAVVAEIAGDYADGAVTVPLAPL
jgi:Cdc6-like AAA superfamily ATPase